jgi:hypothetical protein
LGLSYFFWAELMSVLGLMVWPEGEGAMAEAEQEPEKKKKTGGTGQRSAKAKGAVPETGWMRLVKAWQAATGQKMPKREREYVPGAERLKRAADRKLSRNSAKLAELLTKRALEGDVASAKLLLALAEAKKPGPVRKKSGPTMTEWLMLDLKVNGQWKDPNEKKREEGDWKADWVEEDDGG